MTESQVVNEWISQGEARGNLYQCQQKLLRILERTFPGLVPEDIARLIRQQESLPLLDDWFDAAVDATAIQEFVAVLGR